MSKHILFDEQKHLLKLFKELDSICSKHDIPYYLAGGSAIGVIRHEGFIPWDDDMDLMMFRKDWERLISLPQEELPPNRVICAQELDREYHNSFGRYADTSTTAIHRNQIVQDDVAGSVVDILVMDPVPEEAYGQYLKDLMLYSDLVNDALVYSYRWGINAVRYYFYSYARDIFGRDRVLSRLEKKMFSYPENEEDSYAMRWGGIPFRFKGDMFEAGAIRRGPFEDVEGQVPARLSDYLVWHYGDNWMYIPPHGEREGHDAVFDMRVPYEVVREDYRNFINIKKLKRAFTRRKRAILFHGKSKRDAKKRSLIMSAEAEGLFFEEHLRKEEETVRKSLENNNFIELLDIFEPYLKKQLSRAYIGREDYTGVERYINPVLIPLPPQYQVLVLEILFENGKFAELSRLAEIFQLKDPEIAEKLSSVLNEVEVFRQAISLADLGQRQKALDILLKLHKTHPFCLEIIKRIIHLAAELPDSEILLQRFIALGKEIDESDGELIKYEADLTFDEVDLEALAHYCEAYHKTKNGFTLKEITEIIEVQEAFLIASMDAAVEEEYIQARNTAINCVEIVPTMEELRDKIFYCEISRLDVKKEIFEDESTVRFGHSLLEYSRSRHDKEIAKDLMKAYWVKLGLNQESASRRAQFSLTEPYDLVTLEALIEELKAAVESGESAEQQMQDKLLLVQVYYEVVDYSSMIKTLESLVHDLESNKLSDESGNFLMQDVKAFFRAYVCFQYIYSQEIGGRRASIIPGGETAKLKILSERLGYSWDGFIEEAEHNQFVELLSREISVQRESDSLSELLNPLNIKLEGEGSDGSLGELSMCERSSDSVEKGHTDDMVGDLEESKLLTLRLEVEAICKRNDIPFFSYGRSASQSILGESSDQTDYCQKIVVPAEHYKRLVNILSESVGRAELSRALDSFGSNRNYPVISCLYVDTSTTAFNLHRDKCFKYNGKHIEIIPLREEGQPSLRKRIFETLELGWANSQVQFYRVRKPRQIIGMTVAKTASIVLGKSNFQKWLLSEFSKFAYGNNEYGYSIKELQRKKYWISQNPFGSIDVAEDGARGFQVLNSIDDPVSLKEPAIPEHMLVSEDVAFSKVANHFSVMGLKYTDFYRKQRSAGIRTLGYRKESAKKNRAWELPSLNLQALKIA